MGFPAEQNQRQPQMTKATVSRSEVAVYGKNAALAVFLHRPEDIVRVFYAPRSRPFIGEMLSHCARRRVPYRELSDDELSRIAKAGHHEGLVVVASPKWFVDLNGLLDTVYCPSSVFVALEDVENPHNLGAIIRSAAAFGVSGVIVSGAITQSGRISAATLRVAEGGAELLPVAAVSDMGQAVLSLKRQGVFTVATDAQRGSDLFSAKVPRPVVLVFGNEGHGTRAATRAQCDRSIRIPTTERVQSLNVSVAAAVIMAEMWRTREEGPRK